MWLLGAGGRWGWRQHPSAAGLTTGWGRPKPPGGHSAHRAPLHLPWSSASGRTLVPEPPSPSFPSPSTALLPEAPIWNRDSLEEKKACWTKEEQSSLSFSWKQCHKTWLIQEHATVMILPKASNRQVSQQVPGYAFLCDLVWYPLRGNLRWGELGPAEHSVPFSMCWRNSLGGGSYDKIRRHAHTQQHKSFYNRAGNSFNLFSELLYI